MSSRQRRNRSIKRVTYFSARFSVAKGKVQVSYAGLMSNENPNPQPAQQAPQIPVQVRYEEMMARYANHALLNTSGEECYIEFSSGIIADRTIGANILPIHTRIAMTPSGVVRLWQLLGQAVQNFRVVQVGQQSEAPGAPQPVNPPTNSPELQA